VRIELSNIETGPDTGAKATAPEQTTGAKAPETQVIDSQWKLSPDASNNIIRDQVNHSLFIDSVPSNFRPNLNDVNKYGPPQTNELDLNHPILKSNPGNSGRDMMEDEARRAQRDREFYGPERDLPGFRKTDPYRETRQRFSDRAADMIFPGFGRIESKDPQNPWRLDYLYSGSCRVKGLGMCFSMKLK
jgi:hypothetical protein